ncbi:MAG: hypothetical protein ABI706_09085 [Ilumatobacteraceae bacterium]
MSSWDDLHGVTPPRISPEDAERLLSSAPGADAIHDLAEVSAVFDALRGPGEPSELEGVHAALAAFGAAVVTTQLDPSTVRTRPMIRKILTGKAIATIGVVTLISAGAAAAAGVVPTPFSASRPSVATSTEHQADDDTDETLAGDTTSSTEISTTESTESTESTEVDADKAATDDAAETTDSSDISDISDGVGPDVNGPAKFGLCTAFEARNKHVDTTTTVATATPVAEPVVAGDLPVPFHALTDAAAAAGLSVADFCADAVPGGTGDSPSATAPGKSGDSPSATAPGKPTSNPSATAPGKPDNPGGGHGKP